MIDIFAPSANDQSIYYLGQIFGPVGTVLKVTTGDNAPSVILGTMFRYFNSIVLSVAALIVLYVTIVGVVKTAHEGEFLGKEWNTPWLPIRMVIGIAALVPSASGYCAMQILTMWIILQGIGAADAIWTTVLGYTDMFGSPFSSVSVPTTGVGPNFQTMYQGLVCQATAGITDGYVSPGGSGYGGYYCASGKNDPFCSAVQSGDILDLQKQSKPSTEKSGGKTVNTRTYNFGPDGACGKMVYEDAEKTCSDVSSTEKQIKCSSAQAQNQALQATVNVMGSVASQFANGDLSYRRFFDTPEAKAPSWVVDYCKANGGNEQSCCCCAETNPNCMIRKSQSSGDYWNAAKDSVTKIYWPYLIKPYVSGTDFVQASANNYSTSINAANASAMSQTTSSSPKYKDNTLEEAQQLGWIFAGAYYYYIAGKSKDNITASIPLLTVTGQDPRTTTSSTTMKNLRNNFEAANYVLKEASQEKDSFTQSLPPELSDLGDLSSGLQSTASDMTTSFMNTITGSTAGKQGTNPLIAIAALGQILLITAQGLFTLIILLVPVLALGYITPSVFGNFVSNDIGPVITTLSIFFVPIFTLLVGSLFIFGAVLAVYTPLIPYIVFTMAAVGWFILVIEAMVAAPLVALGLVVPGREIFGKSTQALYYLFGIFLRPGLMVFGMIAAMLLAMVVVTMINAGFAGVMESIFAVTKLPGESVPYGVSGAMNSTNQGPGLVELMIFACVYVMLILAALNKCFALIHIIPDRVLRWIGGQPETGVAELAEAGLGKAALGAEAGVGAAQAAGKEVAGMWKDKFKGMERRKPEEIGTPDVSEGGKGKNK